MHGERQTGASLHYMEKKPDAGDLGPAVVPILNDDTASEVFAKVTVAAEQVWTAACRAWCSAPRRVSRWTSRPAATTAVAVPKMGA